MPFGAFCPLPLRLGPDKQRGWSAQAQSRLAADLVAVKRTTPLAQLTVQGASGAILSYIAQPHVGPTFAPTWTNMGSGHWGFDWADSYQDFDGTYYAWKIRAAIATCQSSVPQLVFVQLDGAHDLELRCLAVGPGVPTNALVTVTVWGEWLPARRIGDYDGALDKTDSLTEGDSSCCYDWFTELQAMRGSAYSTVPGNVDAENFAIARQLGAVTRAAEKLEANSLPGTSDEKLENWVKILGVSARPDEQRWQLRQRCEAKYRAATSSASPDDVDAAVTALLGDSFVAVHRVRGDMLSVSPATYWPVVNPGPASLSLGGGAWTSARSYYWVEVKQPTGAGDAAFSRLMNVDLFELLDARLPAHMTFDWATSSGFLLGVSQLGFAAY